MASDLLPYPDPKRSVSNRRKKLNFATMERILARLLTIGLITTVLCTVLMHSNLQRKLLAVNPFDYRLYTQLRKHHNVTGDVKRNSYDSFAPQDLNNSKRYQSVAEISIDFDDMVHVVQSRFMQNQPELIDLARARLELFETVCLPSMLHQSTKNFVWIIWTDPKLDKSIREKMVKLLSAYPNFLLIGDNNFPEHFRDSHQFNDVKDDFIFSGNIDILKRSHHESQSKMTLETRLDADDGLQSRYLESIQNFANSSLRTDRRENFKIWCLISSVEWHLKNPFPQSIVLNSSSGYFVAVTDDNCVTPGLTTAYEENTDFAKLPKSNHATLHRKVKRCKADNSSNCLVILPSNFVSLRARTPTSAGMKRVMIDDNGSDIYKSIEDQGRKQDKFLRTVSTLFFFNIELAVRTRKSILDNLKAIAADNLKGQCTKGHSCKKSSKLILQKMAKDENNDP